MLTPSARVPRLPAVLAHYTCFLQSHSELWASKIAQIAVPHVGLAKYFSTRPCPLLPPFTFLLQLTSFKFPCGTGQKVYIVSNAEGSDGAGGGGWRGRAFPFKHPGLPAVM